MGVTDCPQKLHTEVWCKLSPDEVSINIVAPYRFLRQSRLRGWFSNSTATCFSSLFKRENISLVSLLLRLAIVLKVIIIIEKTAPTIAAIISVI